MQNLDEDCFCRQVQPGFSGSKVKISSFSGDHNTRVKKIEKREKKWKVGTDRKNTFPKELHSQSVGSQNNFGGSWSRTRLIEVLKNHNGKIWKRFFCWRFLCPLQDLVKDNKRRFSKNKILFKVNIFCVRSYQVGHLNGLQFYIKKLDKKSRHFKVVFNKCAEWRNVIWLTVRVDIMFGTKSSFLPQTESEEFSQTGHLIS